MTPSRQEEASALLDRVLELVDVVARARRRAAREVGQVNPRHRPSALNLVDYVAVRSQDVRDLQQRLRALGLSSLGRMEAGVEPHLRAVVETLQVLAGRTGEGWALAGAGDRAGDGAGEPELPGAEVLRRNTAALLGPGREDRATRIMVTFPSEAAGDARLVEDMVRAGMDVARINCAHDGPEQWTAMIGHVRAAERALGREVRVAMDLAGPKLRTGPLEPGPRVRKIKPARDATGHVTAPARLWLGEPDPAVDDDAPAVPVVEPAWTAARTPGERLRLKDARGSGRSLRVLEATGPGVLVECSRTVYFATGLGVEAEDGSRGTLGELPAVEQSVRVRTGDTLVLTRDMSPAPVRDTGPHRIGCSLPEAFDDARAGQPVWIDDGKIHGRIRSVTPDEIELEVLQAGPGGTRLRAEKGINLPETDLGIAALTAEDRAHLPFVAEHADIVSMSFVRSREDVADLLRELEAIGDHALDVTLKIETVGGFEALPLMLLEAMRWEDVGVMIARGDLAVEAGFERLAEVQEEILWLCEAGHVPVVWATQVLESLAKKGLPSRAEVTDAAMGQRAECVMLNKGPFVVAAIEALDDILVRMQGHAEKKSDMLRRLRAWAPLVD
ncbi:pyruvate kinase [Kocuria rosea]|uniref:pyruvate kinase n=1 Tax=Kocuria rosea TaxID=1275 RepID=UPI00203AE837|nr:pyruvate kinase [Kocuria rosea]MCM3686467.1 pyruvate kinase [Kocuria rosea]